MPRKPARLQLTDAQYKLLAGIASGRLAAGPPDGESLRTARVLLAKGLVRLEIDAAKARWLITEAGEKALGR